MDEETFDVVAKLPAGSTAADMSAMMQSLLIERFGLRFHRETKARPGYAMRLGAGRPKIVESPPFDGEAVQDRDARRSLTISPGQGWLHRGRSRHRHDDHKVAGGGRYRAADGSPPDHEQIADFLGRMLQQPMIDETGLTGIYDIHLVLRSRCKRPDFTG